MFCNNCGKETTLEAKFCQNCGKTINQAHSSQLINSNDNITKNNKLLDKPLYLCIGIALCILFYFSVSGWVVYSPYLAYIPIALFIFLTVKLFKNTNIPKKVKTIFAILLFMITFSLSELLLYGTWFFFGPFLSPVLFSGTAPYLLIMNLMFGKEKISKKWLISSWVIGTIIIIIISNLVILFSFTSSNLPSEENATNKTIDYLEKRYGNNNFKVEKIVKKQECPGGVSCRDYYLILLSTNAISSNFEVNYGRITRIEDTFLEQYAKEQWRIYDDNPFGRYGYFVKEENNFIFKQKKEEFISKITQNGFDLEKLELGFGVEVKLEAFDNFGKIPTKTDVLDRSYYFSTITILMTSIPTEKTILNDLKKLYPIKKDIYPNSDSIHTYLVSGVDDCRVSLTYYGKDKFEIRGCGYNGKTYSFNKVL